MNTKLYKNPIKEQIFQSFYRIIPHFKTIPLQNLKFFVVIAVVFFVGFAGNSIAATKPEISPAKQAIDSFLKVSREFVISKVNVCYLNWKLNGKINIIEDALIMKYHTYTANIEDPNLAGFKRVLQKLNPQEIDACSLDFRLGFIFYLEDKEVLRLFFASNVPVVNINGITCKATPEMISSLMLFLPSYVHEEMLDAMLKYWVNSVQLKPSSKKGTSSKSTESDNTKILDKEKIIAIANKEWEARGHDVNESIVYYDTNNKLWNEELFRLQKESTDYAKRFKILNKRDYQVVRYELKQEDGHIVLGGVLWVFVDKKTGEVIMLHGEK